MSGPDVKGHLISTSKALAKAHKAQARALHEFAASLGVIDDADELRQIVSGFPGAVGLDLDPALQAQLPDTKKRAKREKKAKKIRDPDAPKKPPSAYLDFQNSVRQQMRESEPDLSYPDILRKISALWTAMSEPEKKHWVDNTAEKQREYEADKIRYLQEHPELDKPVGDIAVSTTNADGVVVHRTKDGKEYTGKKRGRKSAADKAAAATTIPNTHDIPIHPELLQNVAQQVVGSSSTSKKEKKDKKDKKAIPPPKAPTPSESDSDSDDSDSSSEEEAPVPAAPKAAPVPVQEAHKKKKTKHV